MIGVVDYGMGNLKSVRKALEHLNLKYYIGDDKALLNKCDRLIIPGVGSFRKAMFNLSEKGFVDYLRNCDKPIMGICLGMQLIFSKSYEDGETEGLGLVPGEIIHIREGLKLNHVETLSDSLKIPHMGWNTVNGKHYYFVHSYFANCDEEYVVGYADYGIKLPAIVKNGKVMGCQFHPEKSGEDGLNILKEFGGMD